MSAVAAIFNIPAAPNEFNSWAFAHMAHHRDINRTIYELVGTTLSEFALDPLNPTDANGWIYQHQQMHNEINAILGISGYNLVGVDFLNQRLLSGWVWLNAQEHYQAAGILGIG